MEKKQSREFVKTSNPSVINLQQGKIPPQALELEDAVLVGDQIFMLENTWYSVISPESCSSILWRSWEHKETAAEALKLTSKDMLKHKLIDKIIKEPLGGAHYDREETFKSVRKELLSTFKKLNKIEPEKRIEQRRDKFIAMGNYDG